VTTARLSVDSSTSVGVPTFTAFFPSPFTVQAPLNPATPTFVGLLASSSFPAGGVTQPAKLEQLSTDYRVTLDDHCYADNRPQASSTMQTNSFSCNSE